MPRKFKTVDYEATLDQKVSLRECLPLPSDRPVSGETLKFTFPPANIHWFDPQTEQRVNEE